MKKTNKKRSKSSYYGMEATTTNKDWGFIPCPCKGGKTTNFTDAKRPNKEEK